MYKDKNFYLSLFQVSETQLERLAADGLKGGGSYCDLFFENTSYNDLLLRDGIVSSGGFHIDYGVGIRVLKGDKTGYAYSESTDSRSMAEAALAASKIAEGGTGTASAICCRTVTAPKDRYSVQLLGRIDIRDKADGNPVSLSRVQPGRQDREQEHLQGVPSGHRDAYGIASGRDRGQY